MAARPTAGYCAQAGINAFAVELLRMGPESATELDPWRDFASCRSGGQGLELIADRMADMIFAKRRDAVERSEEHTSELQSLMRLLYAVFCLHYNSTVLLIITYTYLHIPYIPKLNLLI